MPQVPGTKVWLKKDDLAKVVDLMDSEPPPDRIRRAIDFAMYTVKRCKQAKASMPHVYNFVITQWFNIHTGK